MIRVVKVGGRVLGDAGWLRGFAAAVARVADRVVVVHGGGPEVDALSARLGVAVERVGGRRVTSPEALDVASMVLSGRLNKRLVAALLDAGADAVGLSGEDGALVVAKPAAGGALGRVGEVERVRGELLHRLLDAGVVPVVSPISRGTEGGALNVNADDAAVAVAAELGASELLFLTDVPAVRGEGGRERERLDAGEAAALLAAGIARDGMAVKLDAAVRGLAAGIACVRIGSVEMLADRAAGTRVESGLEVVR